MLIIKIQRQIPAILGILILLGCNVRSFNKTIAFKNNLDIARLTETVTIPLDKLDMKAEEFKDGLFVKDLSSGAFRPTQFVDQDGDGTNDALVFQVDIPPLSTRNFELTSAKDIEIHQDTLVSTYSRFVPERIDDYAWENDRVAFRTYGPEAERLAKDGEGGGTLSSGIDCWLKRVDYPVIDKWYKMDAEGKGSYHVDHGEGLDSYHVGNSRGCGGIGVWIGDSLCTSDNFTSYKTLEVGPIRTSFELEYAPWKVGEMMLTEKKRISLDLGSNLTKIEVQFTAPYPEEIVAGLFIPVFDKGIANVDEKAGWFSYWSDHNDSELGIGIVADPLYVSGYKEYRVNEKEKSHVFVRLKPIDGKVIYYTGFGWKKSGRFSTKEDWIQYLSEFAACLISPIEVIK